jgi:hypothetical protein
MQHCVKTYQRQGTGGITSALNHTHARESDSKSQLKYTVKYTVKYKVENINFPSLFCAILCYI